MIDTPIQRNPIADGWRYADARDDDLEPQHELERRIKERVDAARAEADAALAEETSIKAEVDRLRGDVQLGLATANVLHKTKTRLAKAQGRVGDAEAAVRAVDRWEAREREAHRDATYQRSMRAYREAQAAGKAIHGRGAAALRSFLAEIDRLEADVDTLNAAYRTRTGDPVMRSPFDGLRDELAKRATVMEGMAR